MNEIICIGNTSYDITAYLDGYPVENYKYRSQDFNECGGGPAANAASLIAKWGEKAALVSLIGNDAYGQIIEKTLKDSGVDISNLIRQGNVKTPLSIITVNRKNGSRTLINRNKIDQISNQDSVLLDKYNPSVILFDGYELESSLKAIDMFPDAVSVLDGGSYRENTGILSRKTDYLVCSEKFALSFTGIKSIHENGNHIKAYRALEKLCPGNIVITIGDRGMIYKKGNEIIIMPSFKIEAVDTTGAGDIFHGAFAYGLLKKKGLEENLRFSSAAAALSACREGGMTSIPSLDEVTGFVKYRQPE